MNISDELKQRYAQVDAGEDVAKLQDALSTSAALWEYTTQHWLMGAASARLTFHDDLLVLLDDAFDGAFDNGEMNLATAQAALESLRASIYAALPSAHREWVGASIGTSGNGAWAKFALAIQNLF